MNLNKVLLRLCERIRVRYTLLNKRGTSPVVSLNIDGWTVETWLDGHLNIWISWIFVSNNQIMLKLQWKLICSTSATVIIIATPTIISICLENWLFQNLVWKMELEKLTTRLLTQVLNRLNFCQGYFIKAKFQMI